jgi:hypothetical protein
VLPLRDIETVLFAYSLSSLSYQCVWSVSGRASWGGARGAWAPRAARRACRALRAQRAVERLRQLEEHRLQRLPLPVQHRRYSAAITTALLSRSGTFVKRAGSVASSRGGVRKPRRIRRTSRWRPFLPFEGNLVLADLVRCAIATTRGHRCSRMPTRDKTVCLDSSLIRELCALNSARMEWAVHGAPRHLDSHA